MAHRRRGRERPGKRLGELDLTHRPGHDGQETRRDLKVTLPAGESRLTIVSIGNAPGMKEARAPLPSGSFSAAFPALAAGADGVYLGLKDFSARKAAQNFSLEQLRRARRLTAESGKHLYVAINTIVADTEMQRLAELACWLEALAVDAVIVQDLGVAELLATHFPRITVHASTQMAVHNDQGLRMAEDLGIRRVILSRELPLARIRALRERHPGIELEVFIHGALCYSFSGVCLASWALTGRSGNRGDCAQICRSRFRSEDGACAEGAFLFLPRPVPGKGDPCAGGNRRRQPEDRRPHEVSRIRVQRDPSLPARSSTRGTISLRKSTRSCSAGRISALHGRRQPDGCMPLPAVS